MSSSPSPRVKIAGGLTFDFVGLLCLGVEVGVGKDNRLVRARANLSVSISRWTSKQHPALALSIVIETHGMIAERKRKQQRECKVTREESRCSVDPILVQADRAPFRHSCLAQVSPQVSPNQSTRGARRP